MICWLILSGDTEGSWREYLVHTPLVHTPLVQSENRPEVWGEVHGKRGFLWEDISKNHGKTA